MWLTRHRLADVDYALWRPNPGMLAHIAAVTDVRLDVLARHPAAEWVCERELHREIGAEPGGRRRHRPDALVVVDGREVAVEVELTLKRRVRMQRVMRELVARYGSVTYFAARARRRTLEQLAADVGGGRVQVLGPPDGGQYARGGPTRGSGGGPAIVVGVHPISLDPGADCANATSNCERHI